MNFTGLITGFVSFFRRFFFFTGGKSIKVTAKLIRPEVTVLSGSYGLIRPYKTAKLIRLKVTGRK